MIVDQKPFVGACGKQSKLKNMKYKEIILSSLTAEMVKDNLSKLISSGIVKIEHAYGDLDPIGNNVQFEPRSTLHRHRSVIMRESSFVGPGLIISSEGIGWYSGIGFDFDDTFYFSKSIIFVKSGKPDRIKKEISITKITLLSKTDKSEVMEAYRKQISSMINMCCYYNGHDRYNIPATEIDEHIAFLDKHKGVDIKNPRYKEDYSMLERY